MIGYKAGMVRWIAVTGLLVMIGGCKEKAPVEEAKPEAQAAAVQTSTVAAAKTIDPVCNMEVDPATALSTPHGDQRYYFCSESCRQSFKADPAKYIVQK